MDDLLRELAPISQAAWGEIESEAKTTLKQTLAARRLVDFTGPLGWAVSSVSRGRADDLSEQVYADVQARLRVVQPLLELRLPFELSCRELESVARGAPDADMDPVRNAARHIAVAEDRAVFHGFPAGQIRGISAAADANALELSEDFERYPNVVAAAIAQLGDAGVNGPYAVALGPRCYTGLLQTTKNGYPVLQHVRRLLDGPIVWAPGLDGAAVLSMRGGDFELAVGQDFSIGYLDHTASAVRLYLQESFTFRVNSPEAAVPLRYKQAAKGKSK